MKKSFETYLTFIENELGVQLLCWQKQVLHAIYDGHHPYVFGIRSGKMTMYRAAQMLKEEMEQDNGSLSPRLYELDGYSVDITVYDENLNWKKEN